MNAGEKRYEEMKLFGISLALCARWRRQRRTHRRWARASRSCDSRGTGVLLDYSAPCPSQRSSYHSGGVGEFNYAKGFGSSYLGATGGINTLLLQGGLRHWRGEQAKVSGNCRGSSACAPGFGNRRGWPHKTVCATPMTSAARLASATTAAC